MPPRVTHRARQLRRTFIREWRENRALSQDKLVERVRERVDTFSKSTLSRLERGEQPYSQPILEALAWALDCEPQDLIMRRPDSELWSIMDSLEQVPEEDRPRLARIIETFRKVS